MTALVLQTPDPSTILNLLATGIVAGLVLITLSLIVALFIEELR